VDGDILDLVESAHTDALRHRLIAQGLARSIIRRDGKEPPDGPSFPDTLTSDLLSYGFTQIVGALELRKGAHDDIATRTFYEAGEVLYAATENAAQSPLNGFYRVIAAAAFHLGGYAARSFSSVPFNTEHLNISVPERILAALLRRELLIVRRLANAFISNEGSRALVSTTVANQAIDSERIVRTMLTGQYCRSTIDFTRALYDRDPRKFGNATESLRRVLQITDSMGFVPLWWTARLTLEIFDDLWHDSVDNRLPQDLPTGDAELWRRIRTRYIDNLVSREHSEVELWPSQFEAVSTIFSSDANAVIALPTGAGKTRIAELAILKCLAQHRRIFYVTPLRALSAQIERGLSRAFAMPEITISALYSAIGAQAIDIFALKNANIVVLTPEKLHFALRLEPGILDDVGLIILDEGHMIGSNPREIRYEVLVQRLLRREDSGSRRIICLSAVLPSGEELNDFAHWICQTHDCSPIATSWRPTQLRYGLLDWQNERCRLSFLNVDGSEDFFVPRFITQTMVATPSQRKSRPFPRTRQELLLAAASRYIEHGDSVLVYAPERRSVDALGKAAMEAIDAGGVSFPFKSKAVARAIRLATEWLGPNHVAVGALKRGCSIHHGDLPYPVREEIERLFRDGAIKLMISSPTLAQGLNITVSTVIFSGVYRSGERIAFQEFVNVCGRAGRPFASSEGHILFGAMDKDSRKRQRAIREWREMIRDSVHRQLKSGLVQLVTRLVSEMEARGFGTLQQLLEYALNIRSVQSEEGRAAQATVSRIDALDEAILALIGDSDPEANQIADALDSVLESSLWFSELGRLQSAEAERLRIGMFSRADYIWSVTNGEQRKRFYTAGISLRAGIELDAAFPNLLSVYESLEQAVDARDIDATLTALMAIAEGLVHIELFRADRALPSNWRQVLRRWVSGDDLSDGNAATASDLQFVQSVCAYGLVWAIEALRAFNAESLGQEEPPPSRATPLLEFGVPTIEMVLLMRLGLTSRTAATAVIHQLKPYFEDVPTAVLWLEQMSDDVRRDLVFPTAEARDAWIDFATQFTVDDSWFYEAAGADVIWYSSPPANGTMVDILPTGLYAKSSVFADDTEGPVGEITHRQSTQRYVRGFVHNGTILRARMAEQ
jgi:superfamily II DNA/RNA helicase